MLPPPPRPDAPPEPPAPPFAAAEEVACEAVEQADRAAHPPVPPSAVKVPNAESLPVPPRRDDVVPAVPPAPTVT